MNKKTMERILARKYTLLTFECRITDRREESFEVIPVTEIKRENESTEKVCERIVERFQKFGYEADITYTNKGFPKILNEKEYIFLPENFI